MGNLGESTSPVHQSSPAIVDSQY